MRILEPDARLLPDMSARVAFLPEASAEPATEPPVLVPSGAVHREGSVANVWVVREGRASRVRVELAGETGAQVRVASGLAGGESVVVGEPVPREGQRVAPVETK